MTQLLTWWHQREPREQWLLGILGALVIAALYSLAILGPVSERADRAKRDYDRAVADASYLLSQVEQIEAAASAAPVGDRISVSASAAAANLPPSAVIDERGGVVRLNFDDVDAAALTKWLSTMPRETGGQIQRFQIQRSAPGRVSSVISVQQSR